MAKAMYQIQVNSSGLSWCVLQPFNVSSFLANSNMYMWGCSPYQVTKFLRLKSLFAVERLLVAG